MYSRGGLDRFKKAESSEPFSLINSNSKTTPQNPTNLQSTPQNSKNTPQNSQNTPSNSNHQIGGGQSSWQPPDWAIEPRPGVFYLEVLKDGEVIDKINLDKKRSIFGRQGPVCDFVLDHPSVSRQHAAVVPHKNGSIYVIDLGSVHGTFVANERLAKDDPVELETGQSLKFAASTRSYVLRKNNSAFFPSNNYKNPKEINLPSPPDPDDLESVVAYNTILNRYGIPRSDFSSDSPNSNSDPNSNSTERPKKRVKKSRVSFKDQMGGQLIQVVGISDGSGVGPDPGPIGVKEGSLVGKYESLVQVTVVPKGQEIKERDINSPKSQGGVTDKLKRVMDKVRNGGGIYDGICGEVAGSSWAYKMEDQDEKLEKKEGQDERSKKMEGQDERLEKSKSRDEKLDDMDDLFGD